MTITPIEALMHQAKSRPDSTAFVFHEEVWTYRRLAEQVERAARGLLAWGVKAGDRIALHMMNRPEMLIAYYACFRLGIIAAPLRTAFTCAELAPILQRLKPTLYIGEESLYETVAPVDTAILPRQNRLIVAEAVTCADRGILTWDEFLKPFARPDLEASPPADLVAPAPHKAAVLINTSGTTGQPKFVMHTPDTLGITAELMAEHFGMATDEVIVMQLAMAHVSGLICSLSYIYFGVPFVVVESFDADAVLDNVERHRATRLIGFPYQYAEMIESQTAKPRDLSSLRLCLTAGDICPTDLQDRATSVLGAPLYNVWGASEVMGSLTFGLERGPVARIAKGAHVRLVDDHGVDVAPGAIGELLISGPNVFIGYWNDPSATEQSLKGGWFHTGDLMRRGNGDEIWFVARKKDIIIRGGTNISPAEVEEALVACHPAVEEAVVVGKSDPVLGQRVFGFIKLAAAAKATPVVEILRNVGLRLAPYKVPEGLRVIGALPRNALGKIDRKLLQAMVNAEDEPRLDPRRRRSRQMTPAFERQSPGSTVALRHR